MEGQGPDPACVGPDIGLDRIGGMVAQPADFWAGGGHYRLAAARARHPDARWRAWMPVSGRDGQSDPEPVVLRLSDFRRDPCLSPLSSAASCAYATGRRSRSDPVGAVSDHRDQLSPQVLARYHRTDRLSAAQGAITQRTRSKGMAAVAARRAFPGKTRS